MIIAIPDDYHGVVSRLACFSRLSGHEVRVFRDPSPPPAKLVENLHDANVIVPIRERTRFTSDIIAALPNLRLFSQTGRSTRHIDVAACTKRQIAVAAGTHASPHTVAEHTWALILSALRQVPEDAELMKRGEWRTSFSTSLRGKTLGIYGLGMIGKLVAAPASSFGMHVLVYGRESSSAAAREAGYEVATDRADFFARSDVLCVMVRLTPETRGIVKADDLAHMKPTALFVNTARAELVAPGVLVEALGKGRPGMTATDVYENEPVLRGDHPLLKLDRALCTPHTAWLERETYELYFGEAFDNAVAFLSGRPANIVNPEVLAPHRP